MTGSSTVSVAIQKRTHVSQKLAESKRAHEIVVDARVELCPGCPPSWTSHGRSPFTRSHLQTSTASFSHGGGIDDDRIPGAVPTTAIASDWPASAT